MIPAAQRRAAEVAGRLHAQGALDAATLLPDLLDAACRAAPHLDPAGVRMRLAHIISDSAAAYVAARARTARAVIRAAESALAARLPRDRILAAADAADPHGLLDSDQRDELVLAALHRALRARPAWRRA